MNHAKHSPSSSKVVSFLIALGAILLVVALARVTSHSVHASVAPQADRAPLAQSTPTCLDSYEPDNSAAEAQPIALDGTAQRHTLDPVQDEDWQTFSVTAGTVVTATTSNLILDTDTVLRLYDTDGTTLLAYNDDDPGLPDPLASRIIWTAPHNGTYFLMVRDYYRRGDCLGYDVAVLASQVPSQARLLYLPQVGADCNRGSNADGHAFPHADRDPLGNTHTHCDKHRKLQHPHPVQRTPERLRLRPLRRVPRRRHRR